MDEQTASQPRMTRYFLEVAYKGTHFSGFQLQENAVTIQSEVERAIQVLERRPVRLTGSSRTDAGVHALQNYFHFDFEGDLNPQFLYKINAIVSPDIVIRSVKAMPKKSHVRFDATFREYKYYIYDRKDPFLADRAYYFPYTLDRKAIDAAAAILKEYSDFSSFSKRNTQVKSFICQIEVSEWIEENGCLVYHVVANRFLRGMVRALTATMLKVGRGKMGLDEFRQVIEARDCTKASFAVPAHGLFLVKVGI